MENGLHKIREVEPVHLVAKERAPTTPKVVIISKVGILGKVGAAMPTTQRVGTLIELARSGFNKSAMQLHSSRWQLRIGKQSDLTI